MRSFWYPLLTLFLCLPLFSSTDFRISNAQKDIAELDVGDLDDMTTEVTPAFLEKLRQKQSPLKSSHSIAPQKQQMVFVIMTLSWTLKNKKPGTDKLSSDWTTLLSLGGLNPPVYSIDPGRLLVVVDNPDDLFELKKFLFTQSDLDFIEVDQRPFFPAGRAQPLTSVADRVRVETEHGLRPKAPTGRPSLKPVKIETPKHLDLS